MVILANPALDMMGCMTDMAGAQEIQRVRDYWSLLCPVAWSSATPVLKSDPITFTSGVASTWIDYVPLQKTFCKHVRDVKVVHCEITRKHHLSVCNFCVSLLRNTGGGMWLLTMQSWKSRDAGKPARMVAAIRNIRRLSALPNMLSIWQNTSQNQKSTRTLHPAALIYSTSPNKRDIKPGFPRWETCPQWRWIVAPGQQS